MSSYLPLFIHAVPLLSTAEQYRAVRRNRDVIELEPTATLGSLTSYPFNPTLRRAFLGFEVLPSEEGVTAALLDEDGISWAFHGDQWEEGSYCTVEQMRAGLPLWGKLGAVRFGLRLTRSPSGASPKINQLKIGYLASGNVLGYLLQYGLPRLLQQVPVTLSRWLESENEAIYGINPERIRSAHNYQVQGDTRVDFDYIPNAIYVRGNYEVEETPVILVELNGSNNHRQINGIESIRTGDRQGQLLQTPQVCDYNVQVTIIAQSTEDVIQVADTLFAILDEQGCITATPYGIEIGVTISSSLEFDKMVKDQEVIRGQLPSATFTVDLLSVPVGSHHKLIDYFTSIEPDSFSFANNFTE